MLDLPRFAIMVHNTEDDYWTVYGTAMSYDEAIEKLKRARSGCEAAYLVALAFIAGPSTLN